MTPSWDNKLNRLACPLKVAAREGAWRSHQIALTRLYFSSFPHKVLCTSGQISVIIFRNWIVIPIR